MRLGSRWSTAGIGCPAHGRTGSRRRRCTSSAAPVPWSRVDGTYHLFYCTFDDDPQRQWVRHAISEDLTHWHEVGEAFGPDPSIYEPTDWRDPFVFWNEDERCWWMLVAARRRGRQRQERLRGTVRVRRFAALACRTAVVRPGYHPAAYECPDMFRMGDWWYLVFSNYTDGFATYYRMARSPLGPWCVRNRYLRLPCVLRGEDRERWA